MTDSAQHAPDTDPALLAALREQVQAGLPGTIADLSALVRIPSVSWSTFDPSAVQASAEAVAGLARSTGVFEDVRIVRSVVAGDAAADQGAEVLGQPAVLAV
jgi:hypothetical protein